MTKETCETCRFWQVFPIDAGQPETHKRGTCRRYPPVVDQLAVLDEMRFFKENGKEQPEENGYCPTMWRQASTWQDMWCGEWK